MAAKLIGERLPQSWGYGVSRDGRIFFVDDRDQKTSWLHPVTGQPVQTGYTSTPDYDDNDSDLDDLPHDLDPVRVKSPDLPPGWEQALTIEGAVYFIDHNNHQTTFEHPMSGRPNMDPPTRTPPQSPTGLKPGSARKSTKSRGIKAPSASREENSKVILRGWLQKQESSGLKLWKKKWCVLADFGLFFYKDEGEHNCIGSILLPSYSINPCSPAAVNKKFAFKAEHENMKTFYFAADNQVEMDTWVDALRMASLVQRAPGAGHMPKLIPKSPIMSWNDNSDSPGVVSPPDMQQYPFSNPMGDTSRTGSELDASYRDRSPLQPRENTPNTNRNGFSDGQLNPNVNSQRHDSANRPHKQRDEQGSLRGSQRGSDRGSHAYNPSGDYGTLAYEGQQPGPQGHRPQDTSLNRQYDPKYPPNRPDRNRGSQRSNHSLPDNQIPGSTLDPRSGHFSASTLPRDLKPGHYENRGQNSHRGQSYSSLPRDSRSRLPPQDEGPSSHSSPRQTLERPSKGQGQRKKDDHNPYMMMTSPQQKNANERKMNPLKHSNRPLPQEPSPAPTQEHGKSGGGDYASLTRIRDKWPNQNLSDSGGGKTLSPTSQSSHTSPSQQQQHQRPDLYVDIPHTYVNVYDESQVRDNPPELPTRPPLPAEMRERFVADIAQTHTPKTRHEMIVAEKNLEVRMKQPAFFNYPTPTRESLPPLPQDSPRSQHSQRSQRSHASAEPRSRYPDDNSGVQLQQPSRPDLAPSSTAPPLVSHEARDIYLSPPTDYGQSYHVSQLSSDNTGSDNTLTNEDRNDRISEFYGLGKYDKNADPQRDKNRIMSDMDVRTPRTLPSRNVTGLTGEKDFRLRSLPDHAQSMPSIYHEQGPHSIEAPHIQPVINSYVNLSPPSVASDSNLRVGEDNDDTNQRRSAFRPLSAGSNSLQRFPSGEGSIQSYPGQGQSGDYNKHPGYMDQDQTDVKRLSAASSQMSQSRLPRKQDTLPVQQHHEGQGHRGQGHRDMRSAPGIHTVREEPDMPDSQVIETALPMKVFPLNGPRLRMSISAGDLLGKTHDELVLLLIQLRRDKAELNEQRDGIRKNIEQYRPAEFYYRKLQNEGRPIDAEKEAQHRQYMELKHKLDEAEMKLEVYKPLVNLVCNMVTMGSLYGGDNLMLATEYRKHLLSPEQYSPPKKMLEFSRRNQEDRIVQEIEDDVRQLTKEQADLEEKLDRLYDLDRIIQEQSFQVTSLREDRELLEKALGGLLKKQDANCTNHHELEKLIHQQRTIEKELSRVLQQLAEASKELEETTAENNKLEHEVALLRSKVHGDVSRSKSAPSLSSESLRTKMKMEKDLAKVQNIMEGLSEEGARLQGIMSSLRRPKSGSDSQMPTSPSYNGYEQTEKKTPTSHYYETDIDTNESKDLAQVTALLASYQLIPGQQRGELSPDPVTYSSSVGRLYGSPPPGTESRSQEGASAFKAVSPSHREDERIFHASPAQPMLQQTTQAQLESGVETDGADQWDIGEADDNTKRFFGLIPKSMPKSQTVRDVKRHSENRKEGKKKEDDPPPLRVSVIPSDYTDSNFHVYENLPQQKPTTSTTETTDTTPKYPWSSVLPENNTPSTKQRRRSNLLLTAPKPFSASYNSKPKPYSSVSHLASPYTSIQNINQSDTPQGNQLFNGGNQFNSIQSNNSTASTDPPTTKTPPPPPVRGTSKLITAEVSQHNFSSQPQLYSEGQGHNNDSVIKLPGRNYVTPVPTILKKGSGRNGRSSQKARYMTISSSQPVKLEQHPQQSPKLYSQAGDLISSMEVPDIVKSSTTKIEQFDERTIDREILFFPNKVDIPERYMPDSDEESVTEEEKAQRRERADKIKRILTQQSIHSLSQPDVSRVAGEVHERVKQEKMKRAQLLGIGQELAEQVKRKSRQFAAERRKTWSGTPQKSETEQQNGDLSEGEHEHYGDANNNLYTERELLMDNNNSYTEREQLMDNNNSYMEREQLMDNNNSYTEREQLMDNNDMYYRDSNSYRKDDNPYMDSNMYGEDNSYSMGDNSASSAPYIDTSYNTTSYGTRPNFKI